MPILSAGGKNIFITSADYEWIAERMNTSPSGTVSFTQSAIKRYKKITQQDDLKAWETRSQMIFEFGHEA